MNDLCRRILDAAERHDDGMASARGVEALREQFDIHLGMPIALGWEITAAIEGNVAFWLQWCEETGQSTSEQASQDAEVVWERFADRMLQSALLRELVGNPFHPVSVNPAWLTWNGGVVGRLAEATYADRRFADLPILADALEDAGCASAEILGHCRTTGPVLADSLAEAGCSLPKVLNRFRQPCEHVRGCWVLDILLGKG